jgi:peroxiredoxin
MAPEFTLADLEGEVVRSADLRGKTVVIDFWATWCPPCEFQVPELNRFWESHSADGDVVVLGVSVDVDTDDVVREWAQKKGVDYRVLVGGEELARRFGALGFPTLYVLAPDGSIAVEHVGLIEVADLEGVLSELRAGGG